MPFVMMHVLKDAVSLNCGHTFCDECMKSCLSSNTPSCPNCRVLVQSSFNPNPNYVVRDIIDVMEVKCPAGTECEWTGQVKDLQLHEGTCIFKTIKCSVEGCDHTCQRKDMADHLSNENTAVMMSHMELKYDKKLKEIEDKYEQMGLKYERKFAKCNGDIEACKNVCKNICARLASVEARMAPPSPSSRSSSNEHNNTATITTPGGATQISDEMIVEGCGLHVINGVYKRDGVSDGVPSYTRNTTLFGTTAVYRLYRFVSNGTR